MQATGWCVYNGTAEHTAAIAVLAGDGCGREGGREGGGYYLLVAYSLNLDLFKL